jgi:hypothetical protein
MATDVADGFIVGCCYEIVGVIGIKAGFVALPEEGFIEMFVFEGTDKIIDCIKV